MLSRPTIALCAIMKDEARNISRFLQSMRGCFDEIHLTDTGSTDGTIEFVEKVNEKIAAGDPVWAGFPKIQLHKFPWINDFAAARNFSFSHARTEYIMWADLDDELSDAAAFIKWRDNVLHSAHYWTATYNYAFNEQGQVVCKFIRERVIKRGFGFAWEYFVHEGIIQKEGKKYWAQQANTWWINHRRTEEDKKQDHLRNIKLFESKPYDTLPARMKFYYGKELVENGFPEKACNPLLDCVKSGELFLHDNLLAIQYGALSAIKCGAFAQAIDLCMNGLKIALTRAEYWCLLGDAYLSSQNAGAAAAAYKMALQCQPNDLGGILVCEGSAYAEYPHQQLAQIFINLGQVEAAKEHVAWLKEHNHPKAAEAARALNEVEDLSTIRAGLTKSQDVIITCPPGGAVTDWDENSLKAKGHGGSETAAIEVAKWIKQKTGRPVKIFQQRQKRETMDSGVEYLPTAELSGYIKNVEPHAHIAWRHSVKMTNALSYVWCHDLQCPGAANANSYDKIVALSEFHKNYLIETNGVREDKIVLGFNGINPDDFKEPATKNPNKVIFSSSPDRGLIQAIDIVKKAREISGLDLELHCFYGFENMRKAGQNEWADKIEKHIAENSFVKHHGLVTKPVLVKHFKESAVWLYPNDFIETFCITAIEALCAGTWPIVRDMGALRFTMKEALERGMCDFMNVEVLDSASIGIWANTLVEAILEKKWTRVDVTPQNYSWEKVADFFIEEMKL
jgi:glycosyltransferase involved in cell wall biosynthesis